MTPHFFIDKSTARAERQRLNYTAEFLCKTSTLNDQLYHYDPEWPCFYGSSANNMPQQRKLWFFIKSSWYLDNSYTCEKTCSRKDDFRHRKYNFKRKEIKVFLWKFKNSSWKGTKNQNWGKLNSLSISYFFPCLTHKVVSAHGQKFQ